MDYLKYYKMFEAKQKVPTNIKLDISVSDFDIKPQIMVRAAVVGGMKSIPYFEKYKVSGLTSADFSVRIIDGFVNIALTTKGKFKVKVRLKKNPKYLEQIQKVYQEVYLDYFKSL